MSTETPAKFNVLARTESSNNYATAQIHAGLANHGDGWFALEQTAGKGQRGKSWTSAAGENIMLSIAVRPGKRFAVYPFALSALVASTCREFFADRSSADTRIKWPNDIFVGDRKAAGILIENIYRGSEWQWAVIGVGMNINQAEFDQGLRAVSLRGLTGKKYDVIGLGKELQLRLLRAIDVEAEDAEDILAEYNSFLFGRDQQHRFRTGSIRFEDEIDRVDVSGNLHLKRSPDPFAVGGLEWLF